jgi:ketosteroid isomerase-like protein
MSTPDPLQTPIRMLLRSIDSADWGVVEALLHPQTEYEVSGFLPFRGRDAVMTYYRTLRPIRKGEHIIESVVSDGTRAVVCGRFNGTRTDGLDFSILFADAMTFEEKKIRKRRVYYCEPKAAG